MAPQHFSGVAIVRGLNDDFPYDFHPKPADYMTSWEQRVSSFHTWPLDIKPLPAAMAAAGFYHSNIDTDTVTCFSCKQNFPDWKKHHDPIKRHLEQSSVFFSRCAWMDKVTKQPEQYTPPTPPATPPVLVSAGIPHKCTLCQGTFPSSNLFHKHRRQAHKGVRGPYGVRLDQPEETLRRPGEGFIGRYRVSKATTQRMRRGRRGNTDLFGSD